MKPKKASQPKIQNNIDTLSHKNRLETIKKDIEKGTYIIKSDEVAEKIVQNLKDKVFYKLSR